MARKRTDEERVGCRDRELLDADGRANERQTTTVVNEATDPATEYEACARRQEAEQRGGDEGGREEGCEEEVATELPRPRRPGRRGVLQNQASKRPRPIRGGLDSAREGSDTAE